MKQFNRTDKILIKSGIVGTVIGGLIWAISEYTPWYLQLELMAIYVPLLIIGVFVIIIGLLPDKIFP
jgi:hypothetical protein